MKWHITIWKDQSIKPGNLWTWQATAQTPEKNVVVDAATWYTTRWGAKYDAKRFLRKQYATKPPKIYSYDFELETQEALERDKQGWSRGNFKKAARR